jgi:hypothetical protein
MTKGQQKQMKSRLITALLILIGALLPAVAASLDDSLSGVIDTEPKEQTSPPHNQPSEKKHPENKQKPKIWDMDGPSLETDGINGR